MAPALAMPRPLQALQHETYRRAVDPGVANAHRFLSRARARTRGISLRSGRLRRWSKRATILFRDRPRQLAMPRVTVNGTELYHEARGTGPPVLLIMGATGDGGHFDKLADVLADEFTVITYDRRGNGRSPVPAGWQTTSAEEQADDAAALLDALGVGPAAVFGTSSGGSFALWLLVRHPEAVRGAILHEPGLYALVDDFDAVRAPVRALVQEAIEGGGPAAAVERLWCYVAGDEDAWNRLAPALRERMRATAGTLFGVEVGPTS